MITRYERLGPGAAWTIAALAPLAAAALMVPLRTHTQASNLALIMVAVVAASVVPGFWKAALVAGLSAGVWFDFFLTRPYQTFFIDRSRDVQTAFLMAGVAVLVGSIAARRRRAGEKAERSGDEVIGLYVTAQMLSAGAHPQVVIKEIARQLTVLLFLSDCQVDTGRPSPDDPIINRAGDLEWPRHRWSLQRHGWPPVPVSLPVDRAGKPAGRFVLHGPAMAGPITLDRRLTALALADLAGAALGKQANSPANATTSR